jgi:hypothetical protein
MHNIVTFIDMVKVTLTAKQSENGMVMKTRTMEKKVNRWAQIPGPSSQAATEKDLIWFDDTHITGNGKRQKRTHIRLAQFNKQTLGMFISLQTLRSAESE